MIFEICTFFIQIQAKLIEDDPEEVLRDLGENQALNQKNLRLQVHQSQEDHHFKDVVSTAQLSKWSSNPVRNLIFLRIFRGFK